MDRQDVLGEHSLPVAKEEATSLSNAAVIMERYRRILDLCRDAYIETDAFGIVTEWNREAESTFGWPRSEAIGQPLTSLVVIPRFLDQYRQHFGSVLALGPGAPPVELVEVPALRKDGRTVLVTTTNWVVGAGDNLRVSIFVRDVSADRAAEDALSHAFLHDGLTGLANRASFTYQLAHASLEALDKPGRPSVLMLDVDRFKSINDGLGHEAGDKLIVELARRLVELVGDDVLVARLGGDEFLMLCREEPAESIAVALARKIAVSLEEPFVIGNSEVFVTASIGIAIGKEGSADPNMLLSHADAAMNEAKQRGGSGYAVFGDRMRISALERITTESSLHRALDRDELLVFYQPVVEISYPGRVAGLEALVRWNHPQWGIVAPDRFIPVAEESGLIVPIGAWVLERACEQFTKWRDACVLSSGTLDVNLSVRQIESPEIISTVEKVISKSGISPEQLTLEITESALMSTPELAIEVLGCLKDLGINLAVDDFGTGYSSLAYLKRFPLDVLKVDKSFVAMLGSAGNRQEAAIVGAVVDLGRALGLKVVAEGVETDAQLHELQRLGCDYAQGYLFSPALDQDTFAEFVSTYSKRSFPDLRPRRRVGRAHPILARPRRS